MHDRDSVDEYLAGFGSDRPNPRKRGRFGITDIITEPEPEESLPPTSSPDRPKRYRESKSIIPAGVRCEVKSPRIHTVFIELKGLRLVKFPNATAVMLRTLLDLCVTHHVEETGMMPALLAEFQKKEKKPKDWSPTLRQQLRYLLEHAPPGGIQGQPLAALKRFVSDKAEQLCLDALDKFTHNKYSPPSAVELRNIWTTLDPLMRVLLKEPQ